MQIRGWLARKHLLHQEIRLGAGRNASHADTIPLPLLGGSRLRWRWAGSVGAELALSHSHHWELQDLGGWDCVCLVCSVCGAGPAGYFTNSRGAMFAE